MKADFVIKNVRVFLTYRQCFETRDVAVAGERFFCISPAISYPGVKTIDGGGRFMLPGLVDIHMHIESSMTYPEEFSRTTLPYGVTTVVADAHEIANVFGMEGLAAFAREETLQDIFWAIPSSVPATDETRETSGASIGVEDVEALAEKERVLCLGEIMNFKDLSAEGESRTREMIRRCRGTGRGLRIEGHCPGLSGEELNRFLFEGVDADHTQQTAASVLEKTDLGMFLELQRKSLTPEVVRTVCEKELYENVALVTDDTMADKLAEGQLNRIVEAAAAAGMPVEKAVYCATFTPSRRMHLDDRGMIAPGKLADFFLLDDLERMEPVMVFKRGRLVFQRGEEEPPAKEPPRSPDFPAYFYHSVVCRRAEREDTILKAEHKEAAFARVNVMRTASFGTATQWVTRRIPVRAGQLDWQGAGLALALVYERYGKNGNVGVGLVEGTLQAPGAVAATWSHDSHNLLVLGTNPEDMMAAQHRVRELQGGYVVYSGGACLAEAPLPVGGILSDRPVKELALQLKRVREAMERLGYENNNVIMSFSTLCLRVSPQMKLTDLGLWEVSCQGRVPMVEEYLDENGERLG